MKAPQEAITLLQELIEIPSFSGEEDQTALCIENWLQKRGIETQRWKNNVWSKNKNFDSKKPTLLLNSHHDTVQPNKAYTRDPFSADIINKKLYGLGSNDAGGALVSLIALFYHFFEHPNPNYNLLIAATAEEETAGVNSLKGLLPHLPNIDLAIVGEPTLLDLAVAEKGLVVLDATVYGKPSHTAHPNDDQALLKVPKIINAIENLRFSKVSETLGEVKVTLTQIEAGRQHNVIPATVKMVIDARVNDRYTNEEIENILKKELDCEVEARSLHLRSSSIPVNHPLVLAGVELGKKTYGSPTLSDQAALSCPSLKLGPGDSTRSHTADEFIYTNEIEEGIGFYISLLKKIL
tara:strand:+ start:1486 stop:2538 length:1053 start_codon:yes stop_codon:yes gene_type:complete